MQNFAHGMSRKDVSLKILQAKLQANNVKIDFKRMLDKTTQAQSRADISPGEADKFIKMVTDSSNALNTLGGYFDGTISGSATVINAQMGPLDVSVDSVTFSAKINNLPDGKISRSFGIDVNKSFSFKTPDNNVSGNVNLNGKIYGYKTPDVGGPGNRGNF